MPPDLTNTLSADSCAVFEHARRRFGELVGTPRWAAIAPGRVNLIGEHIDYNDGFVLPMAIDRACVAVAAPSPPGASGCRIHALDRNESVELTSTLPFPRGSWANYVLGVVSVYQREFGWERVPPVEIALTSSVPLGSGLSSSASLECAVATLLEEIAGIEPDARRKALLCQQAEHEFAGVPCGIMDQFISAMGKKDSALLIDCASNESTAIPMPSPEQAVLVVINTKVRHELSGGEYAKRRATCDRALRKIGTPRWRNVTLDSLKRAESSLDHEEFRCGRHVVTEIARTRLAAEALRSGPGGLVTFGQLMNESHESLRDDYRVSCAELDAAVEISRGIPGVFGARMTGGGFGGCAIAMARPDSVQVLEAELKDLYAARFGSPPSVFTTTARDGARSIRRR